MVKVLVILVATQCNTEWREFENDFFNNEKSMQFSMSQETWHLFANRIIYSNGNTKVIVFFVNFMSSFFP